MSNPNDPKQPTPPHQPDPNAQNPQSEAPPEGGYRSGGSSFEFQLPDEGGELLPIPEPDAGTSGTDFALPPLPGAAPGSKGSFDFINVPGSRGSFGDFGLEPPPADSPSGPGSADGTFLLPDLPAAPNSGDSAILFDPAAPLAEATSAAFGMEPIEPTSLPDVSSLYPPSGPVLSALPDIPARPPSSAEINLGASGVNLGGIQAAPMTGDSSAGFGGPLPIPPGSESIEIPVAGLSSVAPESGKPPAGSDPDIFGLDELPLADFDPDSISELDRVRPAPGASKEGDSAVALGALAPTTDPSSFSLGSVELPVAELVPDEIGSGPGGSSGSVPDVKSLFPTGAGSSGSTPALPSVVPAAPTHQRGGSSFEFQLPEGVDSVSDLPPIPGPDANDSNTHSALPPKPIARPVDTSFDFINISSASRSFASIDFEGKVIAPAEGVSPAPAAPVADSKVPLGASDPVHPVKPASGWLDSGTPPAEDVPAAEAVDGSNVFAGAPVPPAEPVELANEFFDAELEIEAPPPAESGAASDVALTFDPPTDDSTMRDGGISDLPVAAEFADADSGTGLLNPERSDAESIHDMPSPIPDNPLFDSATLAHAPDLPGDPGADATDYGAPPTYDADASSILGDFTEGPHGPQDESSVRVEAPGVERTLTTGPVDGAFDLTVSDEPVPAGLFDEAEDSNDWRDQSGSNLLDQDHTAVDFDLEDLAEQGKSKNGGPPSLSSAPSSIFSGLKSPITGSSDPVAPPPVEVTEDPADAVEFTDFPELNATVVRPPADDLAQDLSSANFELPELPDTGEADGSVDWSDAALAADENATRATPDGVSLSAILRGELPDDSAEMPTRNTGSLAPSSTDPTREPVVSVDWLSGSAEGSAVSEPVKSKPGTKEKGKDKEKAKDKERKAVAAPPPPPSKTKPSKGSDAGTGSGTSPVVPEKKAKPAKKAGSGMAAGLLIGALAAGGAWAGVYFGGVIPNEKKAQFVPGGPPGGPVGPSGPGGPFGPGGPGGPPGGFPPVQATVDPQAAFAAGDTATALEHFKSSPPASTVEKASSGPIRVFARVQALKDGSTVPADDADLKTAREELDAVLADVPALAEPGGVKRAVKAAVALGVSHEIAGDTKTARKVYTDAMGKYPAYKSTFEALLDKLNALEAPSPSGASRRLEPADAERILFASTLLLQDAPKNEEPEPGVFYWKAVNLAAGGKYTEAVDQIAKAKAAHAARAKASAGRGLNPLSDPLEQIFTRSCDELKAYWELRGSIYGNPALAATIKKDGLAKALEKLLGAEKDVTAARDMVTKLTGEVAKLDKEAKTAEKGKTEAEEKLKTAAVDLKAAEKKLDTAMAELKTAEKDVKDQKDVLASLVEALKPVTPIPDKWGPADVLAATKSVASRVTGPDLKALVPNSMVAIGGGGLATGQLLDIADRLNKAEAATKAVTAKLETETKRLTEKYDTDTKKLKDDHGVALKKLTDDYAAEAKKLKDGSAEELKKLADKYAIDAKKLTDEHTAAVIKLNETHAVALKEEQARTEAEKKKFALREIEFQKQLVNAVTPGQVMDIWLPVLTELRRPADSAPALAAAEKAITGSVPDSEDAAKARTVAGTAYLINGDLANAKEMFQAARRSPAYKTAAGKPWARAADQGLEAVTDPVAQYRQPVVSRVTDPKAAAVSLDAGIAAYKAGRFDVAVKALLDATKNDPTDPVAWYFLGATRWALGEDEQAKKDFAQGAERERASLLPNRTLSAALAPIQGPGRDAVDRARP
ncbi:hypothetical protein J8F10_27700 [Gemmata sp. G18]|uniref:Tetratricopeptide repeat protein n=1 Tax=Gemmata palustris TaxID=2822762 RepID=A0ABS5BZ94_9BACT|nr:hypothetical protein [Gemmata palustris]MBP3959046.1 hypothetical protein [Gemmata palustris]